MPIRIVESGPAAGVLLCGVIGQEEGLDRVLTFDMGGTTAKLGAIDGGEPAITPTFEVDQVRYRKGSGLPINVPARRAAGDRRRRRQYRPHRHGAHQGRPGERRRRSGPGLLRPRRRAARPSPTPTSCSATSIPTTSTAAPCGSMPRPAADAIGARARRAARAERRGGGLGHPHHGQRQYGAGHAHRLRRARARSAQVRAGGLRRRRPAACGAAGARARHPARSSSRAAPASARPSACSRPTTKLDASLTRLLDLSAGAEAEIADIYRQLEARVHADLQRMGSERRARSSRALPTCATPARATRSASTCRHFPWRPDYVAAARGPVRSGLPGQVRLPAAGRRGGGRGLVHGRLGRQCGRRRAIAPRAGSGQRPSAFRRGTRKAYFPELAAMSTARVFDRSALPIGEVIEGPAIIEEAEATTLLLPRCRPRQPARPPRHRPLDRR